MAKRPRVGVTGNARRWAPSWWCTSFALRLIGATPERITVEHSPSGHPLDALIIGGGNLVYISYLLGQTSAALHLPLSVVYAVLPISGLLIIIYKLNEVFNSKKYLV